MTRTAAEVGPLKVIHDHDTGRSSVWHATDLALLAKAPGGLSALDAARVLFDAEKPTATEKEKARRRLDRLARSGELTVVQHGDVATKQATKWGPK